MFPYLTFFRSFLDCAKVNKMKRPELMALQLARLRTMVAFAIDHCPFYAELYKKAGITKENVNSIHIGDLPVVNKKILMDNFDRVVTDKRLKYAELQKYIAENHDPAHNYLGTFKILHTSGTTGTPGIFPITLKEMAIILGAMINRVAPVSPMNVFNKMRMTYYAAVHGHFIGVAYLMTAPKLTMKVQTISILDPLSKVVEHMNRFQPEEVSGYASSMEILAKEKMEGRLKIHPKRIVCGGDPLFDLRRRKIIEAFGVNPSDSYSMTEGFGIANQIYGYKHLTVFDDLYVLEVEPKTRVTNLTNFTFPIIRYENEDILRVVESPLYDQDPFTQIERVEGRDIDSVDIINNDGEKDMIHSAALVEFYAEGVEKFQFWERPYNTLLVRVVGKGADLRNRVLLAMVKLLKQKNADKSVVVDIEIVDDIAVDPKNGKFKLVNKMVK